MLTRLSHVLYVAMLAATLMSAPAALRAADAESPVAERAQLPADADAGVVPDEKAIAEAVVVLARQPLPDPLNRAPRGRDEEIGRAWRTVRRAGKAAAPIIKKAVEGIDAVVAEKPLPEQSAARERGNYFRVVAASLLYQCAGLEEADTVARLWNDAGSGRAYAPRLVYGPAFQAALLIGSDDIDDDARSGAFSMLASLLADTQSGVRMRRGADPAVLDWPDTHVALWAAAGEKAEPVILGLLRLAEAPEAALASAVWVAARQATAEALPALRLIAAREGAGLAKCAAIEALGVFGHPADWQALRDGLAKAEALPLDDSDRGALMGAYINALGDFGDLRAAADLTPLMDTHDLELRERARKLIVFLLTPEGLQAMRDGAAKLAGQERADADAGLARLFAAMGVPANEYDTSAPEEQKAVVTRFRDAMQADYVPQADEELPAEGAELPDLLAAIATQRAMTLEGDLSWFLPRHLLQKATPADRSAILTARQAVASALSTGMMDDLDELSAVLIRLARSAYREPVGFGEEIKPVE